MAKEWILNSTTSRFQLNFKRNVGATSESIRNCQPKTLEEWREYYFTHVRSKEHLDNLGKKLYIKITEVIHAEINEISEQDCIEYLHNLVINRTYDGYEREIKTIYAQLQEALNCKIEFAPDKWDRLFNVDFFIQIKDSYIGLQIKPVNQGIQLAQIFKEKNIQKATHLKFTQKYNGKVFYIFSTNENKQKTIVNTDVITAIKEEITRLNNE